jgi:hypothetical protein
VFRKRASPFYLLKLSFAASAAEGLRKLLESGMKDLVGIET